MSTDNLPLVSICCVSYNHAAYISEAIKSFWNQEYKNIEILALDDGSTDDSLSILQDLQKQSPIPMIVIGQENTGRIAYNFNKLLKRAKGKYVKIIALDDFLYSTAVSEKIRIMEKDDECAFVFNSAITFVNSSSEPYKEDRLPLFGKKNATVDDILENEFSINWTYYCQGTLFRADILRAVNYLDEDLLADDYALRIKTALYLKSHPPMHFLTLDTPACFYRRHSTNISRNLLRQVLLISEVLDRYYPDRKRSVAYKKSIYGAVPQIGWKNLLKTNVFKNEHCAFAKNVLFFCRAEFTWFRKRIFRIRWSKDKKIIKLFGITFYKKWQADD